MSAKFYAEDMGIPIHLAERIASFIELSRSVDFVLKASRYGKHGKARVYIEPWSQNSLWPCCDVDKWYYDAHDNEFYGYSYAYQIHRLQKLSDIAKKPRGSFSGAKTRQAIKDFSEKFYGEKENWD